MNTKQAVGPENLSLSAFIEPFHPLSFNLDLMGEIHVINAYPKYVLPYAIPNMNNESVPMR
jgi:hypothetical protein